MEQRLQQVPMPPNEKRLQSVVLMLLRLPRLLELKVTPKGIDVKRAVDLSVGEAVVPETVLEVARGEEPDMPDVDFLLKSLELEQLADDKERHQLTTLVEMTERVRGRGLHAVAWYVARGDTLDSFLAQPEGTLSAYLLGVPVYYVDEDQLPEGKLLLVGATTAHSIDSAYGITADIGG